MQIGGKTWKFDGWHILKIDGTVWKCGGTEMDGNLIAMDKKVMEMYYGNVMKMNSNWRKQMEM